MWHYNQEKNNEYGEKENDKHGTTGKISKQINWLKYITEVLMCINNGIGVRKSKVNQTRKYSKKKRKKRNII